MENCVWEVRFAWGLIEDWLSFILLHSFHMNATYSVGFPVHLNCLFRIRVHACHWALLTCHWQRGNQTSGTLFVIILLMHINLTFVVNACFLKEPNTSFIVKSLERSYWHAWALLKHLFVTHVEVFNTFVASKPAGWWMPAQPFSYWLTDWLTYAFTLLVTPGAESFLKS